MASLIQKWQMKDRDIDICDMSMPHLIKAIAVVKRRLKPYRVQVNLLKTLEEELTRREMQAEKVAIQDISEIMENDVLLADGKEVVIDMNTDQATLERLAKKKGLVKLIQ